MFSHTDYKG